MGREILTTIGLHLYQPPRHASHHDLSQIQTDPTHIDWTKAILIESYRPLAKNGSLSRASFDMYGILRREIHKLDPDTSSLLSSQMKEHGVGDSYLHPILPDLSATDQQILIAAGREQFSKKAGRDPQVFWAPESALNSEVLNSLALAGYKGVVCAPEQIVRDDRQRSDNRPTRIRLPHGKSILALPFDRPLSSELAFGQKKDAKQFARQHVVSATSRIGEDNLLLAWTDGETFGHHNKDGDKFLEYLLFQGLEKDSGCIPVSINTLLSMVKHPGDGSLVERSAWSCSHGDLVRWHGACSCCNGDSRWKAPFYTALHVLNGQMTTLIAKALPEYKKLLIPKLEQALENPGGEKSSKDLTLLSAKASALAALTSCGTFFEDPHVSGNINLLFAIQALFHLREAGFIKEAETMENALRATLLQMPTWTYKGHEGTVIGDFLTLS